MSMELVQRALADVHNRELAIIGAKAQQQLERWADPDSERQALIQKTARFIEACRKNRQDSRRGGLSRLLRGSGESRTDQYRDYMESDFVALIGPMPVWAGRLIKDKRPVYPETGRRTAPFGFQEIVAEDTVLAMGWQVGYVEKREVQNPSLGIAKREELGPGSYAISFDYGEGKKHIEPSENTARPVRIWRAVTSTAVDGAKIELRELTYDINPRNGELTTYAEDLMDDEVLGFSAKMFALGVLQNAIEFVER